MQSGANMTRLSIATAAANDWCEVGAAGLGYEALKTTNWNYDLPYSDPTNQVNPWILDYLAYYAIVKGFIQMIESVAAIKDKNTPVNRELLAFQFLTGAATFFAGLLAKFAGTSVLYLGLALGINALARMSVQFINDSNLKLYELSVSSVFVNIYRDGLKPIAAVAAAAGFFALATGNQKALPGTLLMSGISFFPEAIKNTMDAFMPGDPGYRYKNIR